MSTDKDLKLEFIRKCNPAAVGEPLCQYPREGSRGYHGQFQFRQGEQGLTSDEDCGFQVASNARLSSSLYGGPCTTTMTGPRPVYWSSCKCGGMCV